jgi:hypothetical protein
VHSKAKLKSNGNKASPYFRPHSATRCMANCRPIIVVSWCICLYDLYRLVAETWMSQEVRPLWCLASEYNLPDLFAPQLMLCLLSKLIRYHLDIAM